MTNEQRQTNLARIAAAAVCLEIDTGVPAELTSGQCIIESSWLENAPGNNPFGMKAPAESTAFQILETEEELNNSQITALAASGKRIVDMGPPVNGRRRVKIQDRFMLFNSLEAAFRAYGDLLVNGRYFAPRWQRYQAHRNLSRLLLDMSGNDGQPPYFTSRSYLSLFDQVTGQANVKAALAKARTGKTNINLGVLDGKEKN